MDYYTVLGIDKKATKAEIRKAYLKLAKKYHPDKHANGDDAKEMNVKFSLIAKAYKVLLDDDKRAEYDKKLRSTSYKQKVENTPRTIQAKNAFKNGISYYKKGDFWRAEKYFRSAVSLSPKTQIYRSYLGLALIRQKRRKEEALDYCKKAVESEVYNSHFHVNLGIAYKVLGETEKAKKCFQEALNWDENDLRARKQLEKLEKDTKKKGFFSKFFSKGG